MVLVMSILFDVKWKKPWADAASTPIVANQQLKCGPYKRGTQLGTATTCLYTVTHSQVIIRLNNNNKEAKLIREYQKHKASQFGSSSRNKWKNGTMRKSHIPPGERHACMGDDARHLRTRVPPNRWNNLLHIHPWAASNEVMKSRQREKHKWTPRK